MTEVEADALQARDNLAYAAEQLGIKHTIDTPLATLSRLVIERHESDNREIAPKINALEASERNLERALEKARAERDVLQATLIKAVQR